MAPEKSAEARGRNRRVFPQLLGRVVVIAKSCVRLKSTFSSKTCFASFPLCVCFPVAGVDGGQGVVGGGGTRTMCHRACFVWCDVCQRPSFMIHL